MICTIFFEQLIINNYIHKIIIYKIIILMNPFII